jgi:UrcA family protein
MNKDLKMSTRSLIALSALAFSFAVSGNTAMANTAETTSKSVSFADLNLSTEAGQDRLESRVKSAVKEVCGAANSRGLQEQIQINKCRQTAMKSATRQMDIAIAKNQNGNLASNLLIVAGN